ncbi:hypothetical protein NMG60_11004307 [Bertholletia excelsa]
MDESVKDLSSARANAARSSSKLRYPLRSATKSKDEKASAAELSNSASKRGRPATSVSKSVGVLDLSGKDKPAKPPRRLSIPAKSTPSTVPKSVGTITPISEVRVKRAKNETPASDLAKSSTRRKFNVLSSASYWLTQIKLSESAANHKISLGFFKLALEAGCEPNQKMRNELKSYACRHNLAEIGEFAKEILESYNIPENPEQLQVSDTCSQVPEEETRSSDDDVRSSSDVKGTRKPKPKSLNTAATTRTSISENPEQLQVSVTCSQVPEEETRSSDEDVRSSSSVKGTRKLKPKSLNTAATTKTSIKESAKKDATQKTTIGTRSQGSKIKNSTDTKSSSETTGRSMSKKFQKPNIQESDNDKDKIKEQGKKAAAEQANEAALCKPFQENKENMDAQVEEISLKEA